MMGYGIDRSQESFDPIRAYILQMMGQGGFDPGQLDLLTQMGGFDPSSLFNPSGPIAGGLGMAQGIMQGGARSQESNAAIQRLLQLSGGNDPSMQQRGQAGRNQLERGGRNVQLDVLGDRSAELLANGGFTGQMRDQEGFLNGLMQQFGMTPGLQGLQGQLSGAFGQAGGLSARGGMTPELAQLMGLATSGISGGGQTGELGALGSAAQRIIDAGGAGGALIPMEQAQGFARDAATRASKGQFEAAQRRALALGGGPGSRLSGSQFRGMAEFADQSANAEAAALREATLGQQGLQLQQLLGAFGAGNEAQKTAAARLGAFTGLGGDVARAGASNLSASMGLQGDLGRSLLGIQGQAGQNLGMGSQGMIDLNRIALGRQGLGAQTGLGIEEQAFRNLMGGGELSRGVTQDQLAALQGLQGFAGIDAQNLGNAMQMFGQLSGQNVQQGIGMGGLSLENRRDQANVFGQGQNNLLNLLNMLSGNARASLNFAGGAMGPMGGIYQQGVQAAGQPRWWQSLLNSTVGGAAGGISSGISNAISRPKPGSAAAKLAAGSRRYP
jgi:hypothetical protein